MQSTITPHTDPDYAGCYQHDGTPEDISDWLVARGFRITHTCTMYAGSEPLHARYPLAASVALFDFYYQAIQNDGIPFCATLENEDGLSLTVYPEPYSGALVRPNGRDAVEYLAQEGGAR